MDLSKKSPETSRGSFKIVDTLTVLALCGVSIFIYASAVRHLLSAEVGGFIIIAILSNVVISLLVLRAKVMWNGISFDLETRKLSFPGGGFSANNVSDYFSITFLTQFFRRVIIDLDDIQQISMKKKWSKNLIGIFISKYKDQERIIGVLSITGDFGTAAINFDSVSKCNQAYSSLVYYLGMGEPVIVR